MRAVHPWMALLLAAVVLVVGCSGQPAGGEDGGRTEPPVQAGAGGGSGSNPGVDKPLAKPEETPDKPLERLPVEPAPGAMARTIYEEGQPVPGPGVYFLDVATGRTEGWVLKEAASALVGYAVSPDGRFVTVRHEGRTYLADRVTGKVWRWPADQVRLVLASGQGLLFEETRALKPGEARGTGRFHLTAPDLRPIATFAVEGSEGDGVHAAISPDGKRLALALRATASEGAEPPLFYLVNPAEGAVRPVGRMPLPGANQQVHEMEMVPVRGGQEFAVLVTILEYHPGRPSTLRTLVERYGWDGERVAQLTLSGSEVRFSPDGALVAAAELLHGVIPSVRVADGLTGEDRFRVLGAGGPLWERPSWLAGGDRLLVGTAVGPQLVTVDGDLQDTPLADVKRQVRGAILPAPGRADLFAAGRLHVVNAEGRIVQEARVPPGEWRFLPLDPWGESGEELRFAFGPQLGGDGWDGLLVSLPPAVQRPPYGPWVLEVNLPEGDCLNLRQGSAQEHAVVRCLPGGTRLAVAQPEAQRRRDLPASWSGGMVWLFVRTEEGEEGWVAVSAEYLRWAE